MAGGIIVSSNPNRAPIGGKLTLAAAEKRMASDYEKNDLFTNLSDGGTKEYAVLFDANGIAYMAYGGDENSVKVGPEVLRSTGSLTHFHPDEGFGGTLSMQDLNMFSRSNLMELRAFAKQGQLYSVEAKAGADRNVLRNWVKANAKLQQKNLTNSYNKYYKMATAEPIKTGEHAGKIKLVNPKGQTIYRDPMTKEQAAKFARTIAVGSIDRMYKKAFASDGVLGKAGFSYKSTKAGKKKQ